MDYKVPMEFSMANKALSNRSGMISCSESPIAGWSPPPTGFWKINVDATCNSCLPSTGVGVVCRDFGGLIKGLICRMWISIFCQ